MSKLFTDCLAFTLLPANDGQKLHTTPGDDGGATCDGITLATYRDYCQKPNLTPAQLGAISQAEIQAIYATKFWEPINGDDLGPGISLMVFDHAVMTGPLPSGRALQLALGMTHVDGWIGYETITTLRAKDPNAVLAELLKQQTIYYQQCAGWPEFHNGWMARVLRRHTASIASLNGNNPATLLYIAPLKTPAVHNSSSPLTLATPSPDDSADDLNNQELSTLGA